MNCKLEHIVGHEIAIRSKRIPEGRIVLLEKDRYGVFWSEGWQKARPEDELSLEVFVLSDVAQQRKRITKKES